MVQKDHPLTVPPPLDNIALGIAGGHAALPRRGYHGPVMTLRGNISWVHEQYS
ncbi:hypothetical protein ABID26_006325 [Mesorhizobium shonense]|uniref:Uncharacterized protein n=1 Tax=Mesorhizobium shonense TaxID=1209948 RepID=A0ABV2I200_9HYPH